eukprot:gene21524-8254_t
MTTVCSAPLRVAIDIDDTLTPLTETQLEWFRKGTKEELYQDEESLHEFFKSENFKNL